MTYPKHITDAEKKEYNRIMYLKYQDKCKARAKKWWENNKDREELKERRRVYGFEYRKANAAYIAKMAASSYSSWRKDVLEHYSGADPRCACCGLRYEPSLTIDHINGGGRKHRKEINTGGLYYWLKQNNYPKGFRVLCMNCNFILGHRKDISFDELRSALTNAYKNSA